MRKYDFYSGVILFCTILMLILAHIEIHDLKERVDKLENPNTQPVEFESLNINDLEDVELLP